MAKQTQTGEAMPRNLKLRGGVWWLRKRVQGKDVEQSLETGNLGAAKDRRDELLGKLREQGATRFRESRRHTFNDAAERFGREHYPTIKHKSRLRYNVSISNLLEIFDKAILSEIGSARLVEFEQHRRRQGVSAPTIRRDLACLSVIFSKARAWEWVQHNPVEPFLWDNSTSGLKESNPRTRFLSHEEEIEVLTYAPPKSVKAVTFAIDTGMRKEEQLALLWADVDLRAKEALVRAATSKNSRDRWVPLLPRTLELLKDMHRVRDTRSPYVFTTDEGARYSPGSPTLWEALQKAVRRANKARAVAGRQPIEHSEWHDLRRTCGCRLLQDLRLSMEEVSLWLGHSSIKVTERHYAFLGKAELHRAVERARRRGALPQPSLTLGQSSGHSLMRIRHRA